jgi:hypothetical protein
MKRKSREAGTKIGGYYERTSGRSTGLNSLSNSSFSSFASVPKLIGRREPQRTSGHWPAVKRGTLEQKQTKGTKGGKRWPASTAIDDAEKPKSSNNERRLSPAAVDRSLEFFVSFVPFCSKIRTIGELITRLNVAPKRLPGLWTPERLAVLCAAGRLGFAVEDGQHALDRFLAIGPARGSRQVELQTLFVGEADESPVIGEPPAGDVAEVVEDDPAGIADGSGHFEELDDFLGCETALGSGLFGWRRLRILGGCGLGTWLRTNSFTQDQIMCTPRRREEREGPR